MRKLWTFLIVFALCVPCYAQVPMTGAGKANPGGAAAYAGPGDIVSFNMWWGLRAYSAATKGNPAINVCNVADVACADLSTDATTGALVITTIGGSSCAIVTCTIKTFYDQSGAFNCLGGTVCDLTNTTIATRPILKTSCIGSLPCAQFASTQFIEKLVTSNLLALPATISTVAERTGTFTNYNTIVYSNGGTIQALFNNGTNGAAIYCGASIPSATASDSSFHAMQYTFNGASSDIYIDGSANSANAGTCTGDIGDFTGFGNRGTGNDFVGFLGEGGIVAGAMSSGNKSSLNSQQHSYWGF